MLVNQAGGAGGEGMLWGVMVVVVMIMTTLMGMMVVVIFFVMHQFPFLRFN